MQTDLRTTRGVEILYHALHALPVLVDALAINVLAPTTADRSPTNPWPMSSTSSPGTSTRPST
jgi:hypothetical protein